MQQGNWQGSQDPTKALCLELQKAVHNLAPQCKLHQPLVNAVVYSVDDAVSAAASTQQDCAVVSAARDALESVLQLLTRCSCLGSLEAFFMADELVEYFQSAMQAAEQVKTKMQTSSSTQAASTSQQPSNTGQLNASQALPNRHVATIKAFRRLARRVFPCAVLDDAELAAEQQGIIKDALLQINGHTFLVGQDWSAEVNTLHTHADELKVMLCHRQGHYLSLLANGLSTLHACEVEQFEGSTQASRDAVAHDDYSSFTSVDSGRPALADDDFFLPVAPSPSGSGSGGTKTSSGWRTITPNSTHSSDIACLHLDLSRHPHHHHHHQPSNLSSYDGGGGRGHRDHYDGDDQDSQDGLTRMPSSGCSSLRDYVLSAGHTPHTPNMNELSAALHWDLLAVADDGAGGGLQPSMGDVSCSITVGAGGPAQLESSKQQQLQQQQQQQSSAARGDAVANALTSTAAVSTSLANILQAATPSSLVLDGTPLALSDARAIGACLYMCPGITRICLTNVGLDDQGVGELIDVLKVKSSVIELDLSQNQLEDLGAQMLAQMLKLATPLKQLNLQHNLIGDDGAGELGRALKVNRTLQRLYLQHNHIGKAGGLQLLSGMRHNRTVISLKLQPGGNEQVPPEVCRGLVQLSRNNKG
eukprot:jgi/Chrzof1/3525/Cz12g28190.t1